MNRSPVGNLAGYRPQWVTLIASGLIVIGLLMTSVSWWFLLLCAAGIFGPGLLREAGVLHDQDELQLLAAYRAGYHAYIAAGLMATILVILFRSSKETIDSAQELATLFLALLSFTWFLSWLISYWGPQKAASRILFCFGSAWFVFAILSNTGKEWTGWTALLLHPLLSVPFFLLGWSAKSWPRLTGLLLVGSAIGFAWFFGMFRVDHRALVNKGFTAILFIGPLLGSGVALLIATKPAKALQERDGEDDETGDQDR